MRETPRPSCRDSENLPSAFADGTAGVMSAGADGVARDGDRLHGVASTPSRRGAWARPPVRDTVGPGSERSDRSTAGGSARCRLRRQRWPTASAITAAWSAGLEIDHQPERVVEREDAVALHALHVEHHARRVLADAGRAAPRARPRRRTSASHQQRRNRPRVLQVEEHPARVARAARRGRTTRRPSRS